ncbi:MAG: dihydropteroate synthase, partial [Acidimicrobiia bacterium]
IEAADEISRTVPVIEAMVAEGHLVAIDTWKPEVAEVAVAAGAVIINDTGGLADPTMKKVVASTGAAVIAVHIEGANPHDVSNVEIRKDKAEHTAEQFRQLLSELESVGIHNVIVDPGIALNYRGDYESYTQMQLAVIAQSEHLHVLGKPVLIPIPRKRDGHRVAAYIALALEHRADIIRVHDVAMACDLARLFGRAV